MCSTKDVTRICTLENAAFSSFKKVWSCNNKISVHKKLKIYEAQVVSVIMYNSSSWATPTNIIEKLDVCHRKHRRSILNIKWPHGMISNKTLYKRCNTIPLSIRVTKSRLKMLGHILCSPENSPAQSGVCLVSCC